MLLLLAAGAAAAVSPRPCKVAVFGGSGFVGSRVCKTLASAGCSVVSVSRAGQPPAWAAQQAWSKQVEWLSADMLSSSEVALPLGKIDGAISCVGNMRPGPAWDEFFGLHWEPIPMRLENGVINERIVQAAHDAGAARFVYVSLWSTSKFAFGGPTGLAEYVEGKEAAEDAARRAFGGDEHVAFVCPHLIYGGARLEGLGKLMAAAFASAPTRAYIAAIKWIKNQAASGYQPQDAVTEVFSTPPAAVDAVASAVAACLLGTYDPAKATGKALPAPNSVPAIDGNGYSDCPPNYVDGTDAIAAVAEQFGSREALAAAAGRIAAETGGGAGGDGEEAERAAIVVPGLPPVELDGDDDAEYRQSPSAFGSPAEGLTFGFRPYLYPWPPTLALFGAFAAAIANGPAGQ